MSLLFDVVKKASGQSIEKQTKTIYDHRMTICDQCPFKKKITGTCGTFAMRDKVVYNGEEKELCGCIVSDKAKYRDEKCPLGKW